MWRDFQILTADMRCSVQNRVRGCATHPTADSTLAYFRCSKRSLYNPPAACVAPPPTLPVDSCVGCVPSGTHALFGLYRSGRLKANAFRRPFLPNFIRYPAALCVLVRETLDSTQPAVRRSSEWPNNRQFLSYARFCRCVG